MDDVQLLENVQDLVGTTRVKDILRYLKKYPIGQRYLGIRDLLKEQFFPKCNLVEDDHTSNDLRVESEQIVKIFPEYKTTEIVEKLGIFKHFPNRKEIVLRQLIADDEKNKRCGLVAELQERRNSLIKLEDTSCRDEVSKGEDATDGDDNSSNRSSQATIIIERDMVESEMEIDSSSSGSQSNNKETSSSNLFEDTFGDDALINQIFDRFEDSPPPIVPSTNSSDEENVSVAVKEEKEDPEEHLSAAMLHNSPPADPQTEDDRDRIVPLKEPKVEIDVSSSNEAEALSSPHHPNEDCVKQEVTVDVHEQPSTSTSDVSNDAMNTETDVVGEESAAPKMESSDSEDFLDNEALTRIQEIAEQLEKSATDLMTRNNDVVTVPDSTNKVEKNPSSALSATTSSGTSTNYIRPVSINKLKPQSDPPPINWPPKWPFNPPAPPRFVQTAHHRYRPPATMNLNQNYLQQPKSERLFWPPIFRRPPEIVAKNPVQAPKVITQNPIQPPRLVTQNPIQPPRLVTQNPNQAPRLITQNPIQPPKLITHNSNQPAKQIAQNLNQPPKLIAQNPIQPSKLNLPENVVRILDGFRLNGDPQPSNMEAAVAKDSGPMNYRMSKKEIRKRRHDEAPKFVNTTFVNNNLARKPIDFSLATTSKNVPNSNEGATALPPKSEKPNNEPTDRRLVNRICEMFPDVLRDYVEQVSEGLEMNEQNLNDVINEILNAEGDYPKRRPPSPSLEPEPTDVSVDFEILKDILPDADPDYLKMISDKYAADPNGMKQFIDDSLTNKKYPTLKEYQRRQQISAQQLQYTTDFNVENFVRLIPDPMATFSDTKRSIKTDVMDQHYAITFLRNIFDQLSVRTILSQFQKSGFNLFKTYIDLKECVRRGETMRSKRKPVPLTSNVTSIPLLQEIAYIKHEKEILAYLKEKSDNEILRKLEAKNNGLLKTCNCCYDSEIMPNDILYCQNGCEFCKSCIRKYVEVNFGEGKIDYPCLMDCGAEVALQTLQMALSPNIFSKIAQKKAVAEVKAAGIEELEMCPFCDFATIPAEGDKLFRCLNEECMKESCRECKEPNHIPLKCNEVEKDADVKARVFVENQMTEALLRKCYRCGKKFFKEEGCNKMTCPCGAQMCYICNQPVNNYKHFNGMGGDRYDLCPLYSDTNELHKTSVIKAAELAKKTVGQNLKVDPSAGVERHFQQRRGQLPQGQILQARIHLPRIREGALALAERLQIIQQQMQRRFPPA